MSHHQYIEQLKIALRIAKQNYERTHLYKWKLECYELEHLIQIN